MTVAAPSRAGRQEFAFPARGRVELTGRYPGEKRRATTFPETDMLGLIKNLVKRAVVGGRRRGVEEIARVDTAANRR
jgi:hypothetical protein